MRKAFTLIELLVVVLIIGILAAVALPQYRKAVMKSRLVQLKVLAHSLADAEEVYHLANGYYATKLEDLDIQLSGGTIDPSRPSVYTYDWGNCSLEIGDSDTVANQVSCNNPDIGMGYQIRLLHSYDSGKRACAAFNVDLSSAQNQLCKAETGAATYFWQGQNATSWRYQ